MQRHIAQRSVEWERLCDRWREAPKNKWKLEGLIMQISSDSGARKWQKGKDKRRFSRNWKDVRLVLMTYELLSFIWADFSFRFLFLLFIFCHYHTVSNSRQLPFFCLTQLLLLVQQLGGNYRPFALKLDWYWIYS